MSLRFVSVLMFCVFEALVSSIIFVQQDVVVKYFNGDARLVADLSMYLVPLLFRVVSFQLMLQFVIVFSLIWRGLNSLIAVVGGVVTSVILWCLLFYFAVGNIVYPVSALTGLPWVIIGSVVSWYFWVKLLKSF